MKIKDLCDKMVDNISTLRYRRKFATLDNLHLAGRGGLKIIGRGKIHASKLHISTQQYPVGIYVGLGSKLKFGDNVFINQGVGISCASHVEIGNETMIGEMTEISDTDWHGIDENRTKIKPVIIGKHVWIGFRCIILKGVTIGDYSIIGAGSVVTHSIPANTIFAGNPAKQIGVTKTGYN